MNAVDTAKELPLEQSLPRHAIKGSTPNVLADIYRHDSNIVVWQRDLSDELKHSVNNFLKHQSTRSRLLTVTPENTQEILKEVFGEAEMMRSLYEDIALVVDMFCCLFELSHAGLRLTILDSAMCPRFHVDHVPCRLVTTYQGIATEWLNHETTDRTKLGAGNQGKTDELSGLFKSQHDVNRLTEGDVALLKGENWDECSGTGLVHRSPQVAANERRLLLTLDFISN